MATKMITKGMTVADHIVAWSMMSGLEGVMNQSSIDRRD